MTATVRKFSPLGPCIEQGTLENQTPRFFVLRDKHNGKARRVQKNGNYHIEPCPSCMDHDQTMYPEGYAHN